jgi:hypothetical protein
MLSDPAWIGIIVGVLGIVVGSVIAIVVYLLQRRRKELSYQHTITPMLPQQRQALEEFLNMKLPDTYEVVLKLVNSGNLSIKSKDFVSPVTVVFDKPTQVWGSGITETEPASAQSTTKLTTVTSSRATEATLKLLLLNPGDSVTMKFMVDHFDRRVTVDGRIVGVKEIKNVDKLRRMRESYVTWIVLGALLGLGFRRLIFDVIRNIIAVLLGQPTHWGP